MRVSEVELELIPRVLDHGASGVVIAMASSVGLVEEAVRRARYQPEGVRSYGGQRYGMRLAPADVAEIRPRVYPMIEDRRGVRDVAKIAAVQGIAGLHIGPVDLGLGLGVDRDDPRFADALRASSRRPRRRAAGHDACGPAGPRPQVARDGLRRDGPDRGYRAAPVGVCDAGRTAQAERLRLTPRRPATLLWAIRLRSES